jgi:uncharacterized protein YlzI (FlbEa/FlbD family)
VTRVFQVTDTQGNTHFVNPDHVCSVCRYETQKYTSITLSDGSKLAVKEEVDAVVAKLQGGKVSLNCDQL